MINLSIAKGVTYTMVFLLVFRDTPSVRTTLTYQDIIAMYYFRGNIS